MKNGGIDTEDSYPYIGAPGHCQYRANNSGTNEKGYVDLPHSEFVGTN